jgi:cardiolipin synthase
VNSYGQLRHRFGSKRGFEAYVEDTHVTLLHDGTQCFPAMLDAIANAQHEILLEMYWFGSDETGWRFANALMDKAREGLRVALSYDAVGSIDADPAIFEAMSAAGVRVIDYNPIAPWRRRFRIGVVNRRNHRKMLIVDRRIGFTGGVNIGNEWADESEGGEGWRDDMVRIEGLAVASMRTIFLDTWNELADEDEHDDAEPIEGDPPPERLVSEGDALVRVLANHYLGERRVIRSTYLDRIERATKSVYITNSYFVPDRAIRRALSQAADRGVDVRVLLPGESDVPAVSYASRRMYGWLMNHGIQMHEWEGNVLHAKTAVIDGEWTTVGTYNLDYRSFRFNLEVTVAIEDAQVGAAMNERFFQDLESARLIDLRSYRSRPLTDRLLEHFFYFFRKLL